MNAAAAFLVRNRERMSLERFGSPSSLSCVVATPRFRASAHVIFFVIPRGGRHPVLVLKVGRGASDGGCSLVREARNLRAVQASRPGGFDSVPRLIGFEIHDGTPMLLETVVPGSVVKSRLVRSRPRQCLDGLLDWVLELHRATARPPDEDGRAPFHRLVGARLERTGSEPAPLVSSLLVSQTLELTRPLAGGSGFPLVFEHGDLGAPNILRTRDGKFGVVDWELAEPQGLPGQDLFFLLAYLAFARSRATKVQEQVAAFDHAFFGADAWAVPHIERYARALELKRELIRPLFIAGWARHAMRLSERVAQVAGGAGVTAEATRWLSRNRYFALWNHAVQHASEFCLPPAESRISPAAVAPPVPTGDLT